MASNKARARSKPAATRLLWMWLRQTVRRQSAGVSQVLTTVDGYELHMGTNHFGPFLLTGLVMDQLAASGRGRVVTVASLAHRLAREAPLADPLRRPKRYSMLNAYGASKLANLLVRLRARSAPTGKGSADPIHSSPSGL